MKILDKYELRERCRRGNINDVLRLSDQYTTEYGNLIFLRNGVEIWGESLENVDVKMANSVINDPVVSPVESEDAQALSACRTLKGRSL